MTSDEESKILTISIAAYNVDKYLENTLESLYKCKKIEKLDILIINDGSTDATEKIAKRYVEKNKGSFRLISKNNGGYGSTINESIRLAKGKYYKLLDGDDWFQTDNLDDYIDFLEKNEESCVYSPYWEVYSDHKHLKKYNSNNKDKRIDFNSICMHALSFKTSLLKDNNIKITEKCFYTDAEYNLKALLYIDGIAFFEKPLYCYRLGLEGQSVSNVGWLKHYKEHNKITLEIMKTYSEVKRKKDKIFMEDELRRYIQKIYKINFFVALELNNKKIWNDYILLEKEIKKSFPEFYSLANKKMKILRLLHYKLLWIIKGHHNISNK